MSQSVSQYIKSKKNKKDDKKIKKKMKMKKKMKIKKKQLKNKQLQLIGGEFIEDEEPKLPKIPVKILNRKNGFYYENASQLLHFVFSISPISLQDKQAFIHF